MVWKKGIDTKRSIEELCSSKEWRCRCKLCGK